MLPERFKAYDKVIVTVPIQDALYQGWRTRRVETIKNLPSRRGVIICKEAISNQGRKADDLYLAFWFNEDVIRLEEVRGTNNNTAAIWEIPYSGAIQEGNHIFKPKIQPLYLKESKRIHVLTATFFAIMEYLALNLGNEESISAEVEEVKVVRQRKKREPEISYVDTVTFTVNKVTPVKGDYIWDVTEEVLWVELPKSE